jgi:sorting nexin-1/2
VHRFKRSKADDMRKVVLDYVTLQIEFNKATEAQWAELVPEIESIQVGKRVGLWMV